jgi:hypothetical protein
MMATQACLATIRGLPQFPDIKEINVRSGPSTKYALVFKIAVGTNGLLIVETRPDEDKLNKDGKVYQWFKLAFPNAATGWVRDDLIEIEGECTQWGYTTLPQRTSAFDLTRREVPSNAPVPVTPPPSSAVTQPAPAARALEALTRVKKSSFGITAAFEGSGYAAYNNYDAGIISYGLIQCTLAAGSLFSVIDLYLNRCTSPLANELRGYYGRIQGRDATLRHDERLKQLLIAAASELPMQEAQEEVATVGYWDKVIDGYIKPRGLQTPLAFALLFDMGVNFGTGHAFVRKAEEALGVPPKSKTGENGITEQQLITRVAELRRDSHYRQADRDNLPGLKKRGDFWVNLTRQGDWQLQGDANGNVNVNGRTVQIRNPL